MTEFLTANPGTPYKELARSLGGDVAPAQILSIQYEEARLTATIRDAAMDSLVRTLNEQMPNGWGKGDKAQWRITKSLAFWCSGIVATGGFGDLEATVKEIAKSLRSSAPAEGWKPKDTQDSTIAGVFNDFWRVS